MIGFSAKNLGREKSVVLALRPLAVDAGPGACRTRRAAARSFVRSKPASDRIAVVAVGKQAVPADRLLVGHVRGRLGAARTRGRQGARAPRSMTPSSSRRTAARRRDVRQSRVLVLLTDGQEVSSKASLEDAIAAARRGPRHRLSDRNRERELQAGTAQAARRRNRRPLQRAQPEPQALQAVYAALAQELRRTWQLTYFTTARPGDTFELAAGGARTTALAPGIAADVRAGVDACRTRCSRSARRSSPRWSAPASSSARSSSSGAGRSRAAAAARAAHRRAGAQARARARRRSALRPLRR